VGEVQARRSTPCRLIAEMLIDRGLMAKKAA